MVADQPAAAAGEDGRQVGKARPLLLASVGGQPSNSAGLRVDGTPYRVAALAGGIKENVSQKHGQFRAFAPPLTPRGLRKGGEVQSELTVAFASGQMYAFDRHRSLKWKFRFSGLKPSFRI